MTERNKIQAQQAVKTYTRKNARQLYYGTLGNNAGTVDHPTRDGWVYLRLHGDSDQVVEAFAAASFPKVAEVVVDVEKVNRKGAPYYQVLGVSAGVTYTTGDNPYANTPGAHAEHHQRRDRNTGGFDPLDVYNRALVNLRARAQVVPDLTCYVERGFYVITSFKEFAGGNSPAFTAPAGAMTTQRWDLLYLGNDDALHVLQGTAAPINPTYPTCPANCIPIAYIIMSNSSTTITEAMITDARTILSSNQATATAHNVLSAVHSDTLAGTVVDGDVIIGNVTPAWSRLAIAVPAANNRNALGIDNAELRPSWKTLFDNASPTTVSASAAPSSGTSIIAARRDHQHAGATTWTPAAHRLLGVAHDDTTAAACVRGDLIIGIGASPLWTRYAISVPAANVLNVLGVANGDTEPTWKTLFDATAPADTGTAAAGTSLSAAHRDHVHALATPGTLTVSTTNSAVAAHTHAITSSANPGAAASLLATDASGNLTISGLFTVTANATALPATMAGTIMHLGGANGAFSRALFDSFGDTCMMTGRRANNTCASPQAVSSGGVIFGIQAAGYDGSAYTDRRGAIYFAANEAWSGTTNSTRIDFYTTPDSSTSMALAMRLHAGLQIGSPTGGDKGAGTINAAGDIYKNNSAYTNPDYALEAWATGRIEKYADRPRAKDYRRLSLNELESHIRTNYRLPGITDAATGMFERGDIALEKIEELTTYLIELHREVERLKKN